MDEERSGVTSPLKPVHAEREEFRYLDIATRSGTPALRSLLA